MTLRRFYCDPLPQTRTTLDAEQTQHARRSLRLAVGDRVELFDGAGTLAAGVVVALAPQLTVDIDEHAHVPPLTPAIDLAVALPKGARADVLIEKASELGADRIIPLRTQRSVVDPRDAKLRRYDRLCIESAKQCRRAYRMIVDEPTDLHDLLKTADHDVRLIADTAVQELHNPPTDAQRVLVLIGPEGGWTDAERQAAADAGFAPMRLSPNVLRIETAALAAVAILRQYA